MISYGMTLVSRTQFELYMCIAFVHIANVLIIFLVDISKDVYHRECIFRVCGLGCAKVLDGKKCSHLESVSHCPLN